MTAHATTAITDTHSTTIISHPKGDIAPHPPFIIAVSSQSLGTSIPAWH
ncbi:MAG: hypothetical protein U0237_15595 [Thermoleophilia bacterium]